LRASTRSGKPTSTLCVFDRGMATIRDKMGHLDTAGQIHDYLQ
jgi:hypothetical protein